MPPVFVVGFPRSGTTLMRFLLDSHPDLAVAPETHFLAHFLARHPDLDLTDPAQRTAFWAEFTDSQWFPRLGIDPDAVPLDDQHDPRSLFRAILVAYADKTGKTSFGEKTPDHYQHLATLFDWFPDARVAFMVRDPRAVVASYLTIGQSWADGADAYTLARSWSAHMEQVNAWRGDPRVRVVLYEQLVRDPETEVRAFLELAGLRDETSAILSRQPTQRMETGSLGPDGAVTDQNVDAWRQRLSRRQIAVVEAFNGEHMSALGYVTDTGRWRSRVEGNVERVGHRLRRLRSGAG